MQCLLHRANATQNRIEEQRTSLSSSVCSRHLQANRDHRVDFHNPEDSSSANNWRPLQILESSLIQEHKPGLNANIPRCLYAFLTCNRASGLTHDVTCHHHRHVSSWVVWLRMLRATTSLPKQPSRFSFVTALFSSSHGYHKNLQQDHCSSICNAPMMITGVIETFAIYRWYRFHWPWFSLYSQI